MAEQYHTINSKIAAFTGSPQSTAGAVEPNSDESAAIASAVEPTPDVDSPALMLWGQLRLAAGFCQVQLTLHPNGSGWKLAVQHKGQELVIDLEPQIKELATRLLNACTDVPTVAERTFYRDALGNWISLGQQRGKWRVWIKLKFDGHTEPFYVSTVERARDYATAAEALQRYAKLKRWRSFTHQQYLEDTK